MTHDSQNAHSPHHQPHQKQQKNRHLITKTMKNQKKNDLSLFQFPYDFIHPSLIRYKESLRSILKWLENNEQIKDNKDSIEVIDKTTQPSSTNYQFKSILLQKFT